MTYYDHDEDWQWRETQDFPLWSAHSPRVYRDVMRLIDRYRPDTHLTPHLLDVGCGAGKFGELVEARGWRYTGTEHSPTAIDLGRRFHKGVELVQHDFVVDPIPDTWQASFSIVTAINTLHCLTQPEDRANFLTHLHQCTANVGICILTTMCGPPLAGYRPSKRPRAYCPAHEIERDIEKVGFHIAYREQEPATESQKIPNLSVVAKRWAAI